jgi:hypothetical protein
MLVAQPRLLSAMLILMAVLAMPVSAQSPAPAPDLPALTIVPADLDQSGWLHQGAYVHSIADAARDRADYIGQGADADEVTERLTSIGWQREYINFLSHPSGSDPTQPDQITRSYVTQYTGEEGARAGFEYLEDESKVTAAKDLPLDRAYGQQAELTSESGFSTQTGRQFRSLDLTFRMGALIAGVNIIQYPTAKRVDPDIDLLTSLAKIMETRIAESPVIDSALGARVVRIAHVDAEVVTFDDAYYRIAGVEIPLEGELSEAAGLRTGTYQDAIDVYQLWQGIDTAKVNGALFGVTLLHFPDAGAAETWTSDLSDVLATNPFYGDIRTEEAGVALGDQTVALSYASGGGGPSDPRALIIAIRIGPDIARLHLVPQGNQASVPMTALAELARAEADCLATAGCATTVPIPTTLVNALSPNSATSTSR